MEQTKTSTRTNNKRKRTQREHDSEASMHPAARGFSGPPTVSPTSTPSPSTSPRAPAQTFPTPPLSPPAVAAAAAAAAAAGAVAAAAGAVAGAAPPPPPPAGPAAAAGAAPPPPPAGPPPAAGPAAPVSLDDVHGPLSLPAVPEPVLQGSDLDVALEETIRLLCPTLELITSGQDVRTVSASPLPAAPSGQDDAAGNAVSTAAVQAPPRAPARRKAAVNRRVPEKGTPWQAGGTAVGYSCKHHPLTRDFYCASERLAFCPLCDSTRHSAHHVITDGAKVCKILQAEMRAHLTSLEGQRRRYRSLQETYIQYRSYVQEEAYRSQLYIKGLYSALTRSLGDQEETDMGHVEAGQKYSLAKIDKEMDKVNTSLAHLDEDIERLTSRFDADKYWRKEQFRVPTAAECETVETALFSRADVQFNLGYRILKKLRRRVTRTAFLLNANTASQCVILSENLLSVKNGEGARHWLPANNERFSSDLPVVLGTEGLASLPIVYKWTVTVGDHPNWKLGVVKKSVSRKVLPVDGAWYLSHLHGMYDNGKGSCVQIISPPREIIVILDLIRGAVTFMREDYGSCICSHVIQGAAECLVPYFYVGPAGEAAQKEIQIRNEFEDDW